MATKKNKKTLTKGGYYDGSNSKKVVDVITIASKKTVYFYAKKGNDQITITKGNRHEVYGNSGTNTINIKKGSYHYINGGKNADKITIYKGAGKGISVYANAGNDTITVKGGTGHYIVGDAMDRITMYDKGSDSITIQNVKNSTVNGKWSNDTITVNSGCLNNRIIGGEGNDTVNLNSGSGEVSFGYGNDTLNVTWSKGLAKYDVYGENTNTVKINNLTADQLKFEQIGDWITITANDTALYGLGSIVIQGYQKFGAGVVCKGNTIKKFS